MISPSQSQCLSPQQRTQRNPRLATQSHPHHRPVLAAAHRRAAASFLNTQQQQKQHWRGVEHAVQQQQQQQHPRKQQQPASWICRSFLQASEAAPEPIPDDVQLELNPDQAAKDVLYDETNKTVRIPLAALTDGQRRTKMVMFTCNKCGGRSARLVNPLAWEKGAVFCQCQHCEVWHMLKADKSIVEEIRYNDPGWQLPEAQPVTAAEAAAAGGVAELVAAPGGDSQQSSGTGLALGSGEASNDDDDGEVTSKQQ